MIARRASQLALFLGLLFVAVPVVGQQPTSTRHSITYFDRKDNRVTTMDTPVAKENISGIAIMIGKDQKIITSPDIIRVDYGGIKGVTKADIAPAELLEDNNDYAGAREKYSNLMKKVGDDPIAKRYFGFRDLYARVKLADRQERKEDFQAEAGAVAKDLVEYFKNNDKGWEAYHAIQLASRLYSEMGKHEEAAKVLGELARHPELMPELKLNVMIAEAAATIRAGNGLAAEGILADLEKDSQLPASGPLRQQLNVLKVAAKLPYAKTAEIATEPKEGDEEKPEAPADKPDGDAEKPTEAAIQLEKAIADNPDSLARAYGYSFLGDLYMSHGFGRDAMWAYLWVDVVYNQESAEQVLAVGKLAELFDKLGDTERADQFRDKLLAIR